MPLMALGFPHPLTGVVVVGPGLGSTFPDVEEILRGIWHWAAPHPRIKIRVHSYYFPTERTLIDPIAPAEGLDWSAEHGPPSQILLTNRHHYR